MRSALLLPSPTDLVLRTRWYVNMRWFFLIAIAVPSLASLYIGEGWSAQVQRDSMLGLIAISSNGIFLVLSKAKRSSNYYRLLASVLLAIDILLITFLIFTKGGVESRSPILYTIPILMSAAIFGRKAVYPTAAAITIAYSGLIIGDYLGVINSVGAVNPTLKTQFPYVINTLAFFTSMFAIISTMADFITHQLIKKEKQALSTAEALQRAQAIAHLGSWEWHIPGSEIIVSDELYRLLGLKPGTPMTYRKYLKHIHPDDRELVQSHIDNALSAGHSFSFNHRLLGPDDTTLYVHGEGLVTTNKHGSPVRILGTVQDVTAERALDNAKDEFVSLASHQLRTPATGVKAYLSLLMDGFAGQLTHDQEQLLSQAYSANERQLYVIDGLLSVASIESGRLALQKVITDLGMLVDGVVMEHRPALEAQSQSIIVRKSAKSVMAEVDQNRFRMVVDNLLSNASKYTPAGGKIILKLTRQRNNILLSVSDDGVGIAKKDLSKLFKKFSRIANDKGPSADGTGLGLYLVKYIVELHGGEITVASTPGKGTTFTIRLDAAAKPSRARAIRALKSIPGTPTKRSVRKAAV